MRATPPAGVEALTADQAAYDALQDERLRALRRWVVAAVGVALVASVVAAAALLLRPSSQPLAPAPIVHVAAPPACPPAPPCPACAACPACPSPVRSRHAR